MNDPRPLVPVNPEGLTELMNELLAPIATPTSTSPRNSIILAPSFITDPENYIGIPQVNSVIAKKESDKNLNWKGAVNVLLDRTGAYHMPNIPEFVSHFYNVLEAAQGKRTLYDGKGKPIKKEEVTNLYKCLTTNFDGGCWTWLDANFVKGSGFNKLNLRTNHRKGAKGKLVFEESPLEVTLGKDCYVDLNRAKLNKQYLPKPELKSQNQSYRQGENIYFRYPVKDTVAWFGADSDWADLVCGGDPSDSLESLGVFVCAEGASRENREAK